MATTQTADRKPAGKTAPTQPAAAPTRASGSMSSNKVSTLLPAKPVAPQVSGKVAADEVDLSSGKVALAPAVVDTVKDGGDLDVKVRLPGLAEGDLKLRRRGDHFSTLRDQGILLAHPALGAFSAVTPTMLVLHVADDMVTGWVGVGAPGPVRGTSRSLFEAMTKAGDVLGWAGLSGITIPAFHNQFANGTLDVRAERLAFKVGGFLSGSGSAALDNKALSFDGSAKVEIPGGSGGELRIKKDPAGLLSGKLDMQVAIGKVGGTVTATLTNGFVSVMGSVGYNGDRLSGKVTLVATDEATARDVTLKKPEGGEVPIELPGPDKPVKPGPRAYCGWGRLTFQVTDWLAGTATVIVNSKGQATIVGEIAPPREFILFEQKEWIKRIFKLEIRAGYGIPVVGQVAIFASIALDALAKIGPGKLYNIKLTGAYSTDPRVPKQLSIEGTLNISAFAGLRARAEAGLVVTIIGHDIKAGVGLAAIAGVRGYVEATPRIGMREPAPGQRQYYIQGHLEIAAQPILGFSGELFVAIETPWWSPLSDKRWTWPLFSLEYPLPGEFGIGADVDYVLGSKQWPKIAFGEVNFDSSKFLTDVMNDNTDSGSGGEQKKQGEWQEGLGAAGAGGAKNKGGAGKNKAGEEGDDIGPIGEEMAFSDGREQHRLWIEEKGADAATMLASEGGKIEFTFGKWSDKFALELADDATKSKALIAQARQQSQALEKLIDDLAHRKQAARNARAYHKKYGNSKKGSKDKSKKDLRKAKKDVREAQRALEKTVEQLAKLITEMPFQPITAPATMHEGTDKVEIVAQGMVAAIRVAGGELTAVFSRILGGPVGTAINKSAERLVRQAWNDLVAIGKEVAKTRIKSGQVNVRAYQPLLKQIQPIAAIVGRVGKQMRIPKLQPRASQLLPLQPATAVAFTARPATPEDQLYRRRFMAELRRQLSDQQRDLNRMPVDRWFANLALFRMNQERYLQLDVSARETVRQVLLERARAARDRTRRTVTREERRIVEFLAAGGARTFVGELATRLVRANQRREAVRVALDELVRAASADDMPRPELLRPLYPGLREKMEVRIGGRQGAERAARARYRDDLERLIDNTAEWEGLANEAGDLAILHRPDQVAGGYDRFPLLQRPPGDDVNTPAWREYLANLRRLFGPADVNSTIGREWSRQVNGVFAKIRSQVVTQEAQPINRLNLRLSAQGAD